MRTLALTVIDRLVLVACGPATPSDEDWARYLATVEATGIEKTMQIIATEGGEPTAMQRRLLQKLLDGHAVPFAILSGSVRVRGSVKVWKWFNRMVDAFPPTGLREAVAYLEIPVTRAGHIEAELRKLRRELVTVAPSAKEGAR